MYIKALMINVQTNSIFFKSYDPEFKYSPELIGGFLSALSLFAADVSKDQIKAIIMGKSKIYYKSISEDSDKDIKLILFTNLEIIDSKIKYILDELKESILQNYVINDIISHMYETNYFLQFENIADQIIRRNIPADVEETSEELISIPIKEKNQINFNNVSLPILFKIFKKNLGKIIFSIYIRKRIIIAGDPASIKLVINSIEIFSPLRKLKKIYWTEDPENTMADIVGVPIELSGLFIDSSIANLEKNIVSGIENNKYFDGIIKKIKKLKTSQVFSLLNDLYNFLIGKEEDLIELANQDDVSDNDLIKFTNDIDKAQLKVLEESLKAKNPRSLNRLKRIFDRIDVILLHASIGVI